MKPVVRGLFCALVAISVAGVARAATEAPATAAKAAAARAPATKAKKPGPAVATKPPVEIPLACLADPARAGPECAPEKKQEAAKPARGKPLDGGGDVRVGVKWNATSEHAPASQNSVISTVDAVNKSVPGASQIQPDSRVGVGVDMKMCLFCGDQ